MRFAVLGPVEVIDRGTRIVVGREKERALLALLVLHANRVTPADRLADELWDGAAPDQSAAALRVYISRLRKALGDEDATRIETRPTGYLFNVEDDELDVVRAERLVGEGHRALAVSRPADAALRFRDALGLFRGVPYEEIATTAAGQAESARLSELRLGAIEARVEADLACGRHAELLAELEGLVADHPLREGLWEARLLALYRSGRQADALRAYQEVRVLLAEELGLVPGPGLASLEQAILDHDPDLLLEGRAHRHTVHEQAPAVEEGGVVPLPAGLRVPAEALRFVGRGHEVGHLLTAWDKARSGDREVVLVAGEPGIGKTTLAAHLASVAHEQGATVFFGHCDEAAVIPFQPFVEALDSYTRACQPQLLRKQLGDAAGDVALLLPQLSQRIAGLPELAGRGATNERHRLFEAVPTFLARVAADGPVLLVIDDLQWADRPTLQLLQHAITQLDGTRVLLIGTYRDTDLVRTHPMAEALLDLRRAGVVQRLLLRGLSRDEVAEVIAPAGAEPDDLAFADALWTETDGSPLFVREILRHLGETGAAERDEEGHWRAHRRLEQLGIPEGVKDVIGRRLTRLSDQANAVLSCASVQGRRFRVDLVDHLLPDVGIDAILDALDEATQAGVTGEVAGVAGQYEFTHALVREALYEELSLTRRVRLHQRVGEGLEALHTDDLEPFLGELAHHFTQAAVAGNAEKAVDYGRRAGEAALQRVAYEQAIAHFSVALEVATDAGLGAAIEADLLVARSRADWRIGNVRQARRLLSRAADLARALDDAALLGEVALGYAAAGIRPYWVEIGQLNEAAIALLEEALAALPADDSLLRARLLSCLAAQIHVVPDAAERRDRMSAEAIAMARRLGDPGVLAYTLATRSLAVWSSENCQERLDNANEAIAISPQVEDRFAGEFHRYTSLMELGDVEAAYDALGTAAAIAQSLKDPLFLASTDLALASFLVCGGRLEEAEELARRAFLRGQAHRDLNAFALFVFVTAWIRRMQGRAYELFRAVQTVIMRYPLMEHVGKALEIMVQVEAGDLDAGRVTATTIDMDDIPESFMQSMCICAVGLAMADLDRPDQAEAYYRRMLPWAGRPASSGGVIPITMVDVILGALATALGRHDDAVAHLEAALADARRLGWHAVCAEAQMRLAAALLARQGPGDLERAADVAAAAAAACEAMGLAGMERRSVWIHERALGSDIAPLPPIATPWTRRDRAKARMTSGGRRVLGRATRDRTDEELVRRFGTPLAQKAMFNAMAKAFQPSRALGFEGTIQFELRLPSADADPLPPDWWTIEVAGPRATARRGRTEDPTTWIAVELPDLLRISGGEIDPIHALIEGLMEVGGDILTASRLGEMFGVLPDLTPPEEQS